LDDFHGALQEAVDEALLELSESVRSSLYWFLENYRDLKREEIPLKPEEFMKALKAIFGEGADIILKWVVRKLYAKLGLAFEEKAGWGFMDYVKQAEKQIG
jgi:hypothetical protein